MKKITLLFSFIACALLAQGQNLLTNAGFETWTAGKPDSWTLGTTGTVTQSTTTPSGSGNALQIAATGTFSVTQNVPAPVGGFDGTKTYKISFKYKATAGDGTDARTWCNWITSEVGAATTTYWSMTLTDSLALKGPGGNSQPASGTAGTGTNGYLVDSRNGGWLTYSYSFTPPSTAKQFSFQIRTYNGATVIWDDLYFGIDESAGINSPKANPFNASVIGKKLVLSNVTDGSTVEIYTALGSKVQSSELVDGSVVLNNLSKGLYIVRVGKQSQKFML